MVVHAEPPTSNTKVLREYLGKYICRIGLSKTRFKYDVEQKEVQLQYKDYKKKDSSTGAVPMGIKKMKPLVAIDQIMQHCLPAYFQKCRYYGLHSSRCKRKYEDHIPEAIKNNDQTIRTLFQILHHLLGLDKIACGKCKAEELYARM